MSDDWIRLIPENPYYVPSADQAQTAKTLLTRIAPAGNVEMEVLDQVAFFDCGGNFETVRCPACKTEVTGWWGECMSRDYENGFRLDEYELPCCQAKRTLNELTYEWPQSFGKFALSVMNPNIGKLSDKHQSELESILGSKLRVIYQHL